MQTVIIHLDMNSFFASCEQQDNLGLRGVPVGVCEHLGGIIIAPSIEAKKWGIKTGTPVWEAKKLYPKIILVKVGASRYRFYSKKMMKLVSDYTDKVEQYSIDEVFLDLTKACNIKKPIRQLADKYQISNLASIGKNKERVEADLIDIDPFEEAKNIALDIKKRMKTEVGDYLRCSVGISSTKLVAKIASDLKKPNGLTVIRPEEIGQLYQKLELTDVPGIGSRLKKSLNSLGIKTLLDLKNYPETRLVARYGFLGHQLYRMGQLENPLGAEVEADEDIKSIGHMYTLPIKFREKKFFVPVLFKLCEMVGQRMRKQNLMGGIIHFYVYGRQDGSFGKSHRLNFFVWDGREIFLHCMEIFENLKVPASGLKLIGVSMSGLVESFNQQTLFPQEARAKNILPALDKINKKYGDFTICRLPVSLASEVFRDSVGFGRIKELAKEE